MPDTNVSCSNVEACYSCRSCRSCYSCYSCRSCSSCDSCDSCSSCYSCRSCSSCYSCRSCDSCECVKNALFCKGIERRKNVLFNVDVTDERFREAIGRYTELLGGWEPRQTNGHELYLAAGSDWTKVDTSKLKAIEWNDSWKSMPQAAIDYLRSLPEWDGKLFTKITGLEVHAGAPAAPLGEVLINGVAYVPKANA